MCGTEDYKIKLKKYHVQYCNNEVGLQHRNYIISKPIKEQAFSEGDV